MNLRESLEQFTAPVYGKTRRTPDTYRTVADHCTGHLQRLVAEYRSVKNKCVLSDYKKSCINSMIGGFKPNTQKKVNWRSVHVTESKIEALQYSLQYEGSFMSSF